MGVTIGNKYHSIDGGYGMMLKIRENIAKSIDKEFGKHYATLKDYSILVFCHKATWEDFDKKTIKILSDERFKNEDKDIIDFLFMSDCDGKISYKTCKKIYDLIKDDGKEFGLGYYILCETGVQCSSWSEFKEILKECYSKRMNLIWY